MDANDMYLNKYLDKQQDDAVEYEEMLDKLRELTVEIIESYGYFSSDLQNILKDI